MATAFLHRHFLGPNKKVPIDSFAAGNLLGDIVAGGLAVDIGAGEEVEVVDQHLGEVCGVGHPS